MIVLIAAKAILMNSAQHLIIAARTRLVPIEIFARGRWVVVEMTDDRPAIERKFQALQRFAQRYKGFRKAPIEAVVFASEKSDIGVVSVVGLQNVSVPPKLADVFATGKSVRRTFWQNIFSLLGEDFDPPVESYDAIAAERLFASEAAKTRSRERRRTWIRLEILATLVAALVLMGFAGAWLLENMANKTNAVVMQEQGVEDAESVEEPIRKVTKSERMSGLASYFNEKNE